MADLITLQQAQTQIPSAPDSASTQIAQCVSAASNVIQTYCNCQFSYGQWDELHSVVGPTDSIWVNNPPIDDLIAVRDSKLAAIYILCSDPLNQTQFARVLVTSTGVTLQKMYNAVLVTDVTFDYETYPTFTQLAAGINALGNGWTSTLPNQFALWQTSDLTTNQSGRSARNISLPLTVYWQEKWNDQCKKELGQIIYPFPLRGPLTVRVTYTGGYQTVPIEIQQACQELVQLMYATIFANPLMSNETLDRYSYTRVAHASFDQLSLTSKMALNQFKIQRYTVQGVPAQQ